LSQHVTQGGGKKKSLRCSRGSKEARPRGGELLLLLREKGSSEVQKKERGSSRPAAERGRKIRSSTETWEKKKESVCDLPHQGERDARHWGEKEGSLYLKRKGGKRRSATLLCREGKTKRGKSPYLISTPRGEGRGPKKKGTHCTEKGKRGGKKGKRQSFYDRERKKQKKDTTSGRNPFLSFGQSEKMGKNKKEKSLTSRKESLLSPAWERRGRDPD